jgi:DNA-binding NtrC family response regulator
MASRKEFRLLVCDPDPQDREMIRGYLKDSPIKVSFTSQADPLDTVLVRNSPFEAVLIDLSNPAQRSCDALVSAVKRVSPAAEIIFLSRLADEVLWSQVLSLGAYDLLPKPVERQELLRTVLGAVQNQHAA